MKALAKALSEFIHTSALNLTSEVIIELFERSPLLREMCRAKSYARCLERIVSLAPANQFRILDIAPAVHKCVDPLCPLCVRRRAEAN